MPFGPSMTICMQKYPPALLPEGVFIDAAIWAPLTVMCVSFGLNLSYTPTMSRLYDHAVQDILLCYLELILWDAELV